MGYVSLQSVSKFIPPSQIPISAGTWTPTVADDLVCELRTAAASGFSLLIPITLPGSVLGGQGARVKSVDIWYEVGTAALAGMASVNVKKQALAADSVAVTGADYTYITIDANHDTDAERITIASHKMTITFNLKPYITRDACFVVVISCEGAATSVLSLFGAQANFELRI